MMIIRALPADPELAFNAWLDPFLMHRWMQSTPDHEIIAIELQPRTGGNFTIVEQAGERENRICGRFDAVERSHHLALTLTDASAISIDIVPCESGCEVRFEPGGPRQDRWTAMIDRLVQLIG